MRFARHMISALVSLLLVFTSITTLEARTTNGPVFSLVICSDGAAKTITVDGQGAPVSTAHTCLDCCLVAFGLPDATQHLTILHRIGEKVVQAVSRSSDHIAPRFGPYSRGPPSLA